MLPGAVTSAPSERSPLAWVAVGAALGGVVLGGVAVWLGVRSAPATAPRDEAPPVAPASPSISPASPGSLVDAVARTARSVVNLCAGRVLGAGVIVDPSGILLTNDHVVAEVVRRIGPAAAGADTAPVTVTAVFQDGRELQAAVLFSDPEEDIALLRLQPADSAERFSAAVLGNSGNLRVGEDVFALGNPLGLSHTLSRGIVSALDRTDVLPNRRVPVIQLDAAINVGNSGGPLFDLGGNLVGIVTARIADVRGARAEGIAFALPIDHVRAFLRAVTSGDDAVRSGIVGIMAGAELPLPPAIAQLGYTSAVRVTDVYPGYPAQAAGIRAGDSIVEIRGRRFDGIAQPGESPEVSVMRYVQQTVRALFPGEKLPVTLVRAGKIERVEVAVAAASPRDQAMIEVEEALGIVLAPGSGAPTIAGVVEGSWLARSGYSRALIGQRIQEILGHRVATVEDAGAAAVRVRSLLRTSGTREIGVALWVDGDRGRARIVVPVTGD
jgi:S1-C subfamily serine protease